MAMWLKNYRPGTQRLKASSKMALAARPKASPDTNRWLFRKLWKGQTPRAADPLTSGELCSPGQPGAAEPT
jgi:hypothetical protein